MQIYARPGWRMARQLSADLFVLGWLLVWWWAARAVGSLVDRLAGPAQRIAETARGMSEQMNSAGERVGSLPGVGDELGEPFSRMSGGLQQITEQSQEQVDLVHQLANATSAITFLVPALVVLALWLPRRVRFIRQAAAARRVIDADADLELFALRAMANVPMHQLATISDDPVGEWRRGNSEVIRRLAGLELERTGLAMPAPVRPQPSTDQIRRSSPSH
ncbi:hypothetical protein [Luteococcus sp. OSA5]|uniref:hypothetical protein n=1 Tax=Luteococcus sp. OSA5 TaxID=3401630 RepID=UPI003B43398D